MTIDELITALEDVKTKLNGIQIGGDRNDNKTPVMVLDVEACNLMDVEKVVIDSESVLLFTRDLSKEGR